MHTPQTSQLAAPVFARAVIPQSSCAISTMYNDLHGGIESSS